MVNRQAMATCCFAVRVIDTTVMSSSWPNFCAAAASAAAVDGFRSMALDLFESEELTVLVLRFRNAVRHEHKCVAGIELKVHHGEFGSCDHAQRERALHGQFFSVQIRWQMTGIGQSPTSLGIDAQRKAGRMGLATPAEPLVQLVQYRQWISIVAHGGADGAYDQGHEHTGLQAFAGYVTGHNQDAAVAWVREDLKEITTHLACRAVLALDGEPWNIRQFLGDQNLLHFLRLPDILHHRLLSPLRTAEAAEEDDRKAQQHGELPGRGEIQHDSEGEPDRRDVQPMQYRFPCGKGEEKDCQEESWASPAGTAASQDTQSKSAV